MMALRDSVYKALVEDGFMEADYMPEHLPERWASIMLDEGANSAQIAKTVRVGPAMAYTQARNDKFINLVHPRHPEVSFKFATRQYTAFTLVIVVPVFKVYWTHKLAPSEWCLKSKDQIRICWDALRRNPDDFLLEVFSPDDVRLIRSGSTHRWTWHHCVHNGTLELVPSLAHRQCGHTGGDALWTFKDKWKKK